MQNKRCFSISSCFAFSNFFTFIDAHERQKKTKQKSPPTGVTAHIKPQKGEVHIQINVKPYVGRGSWSDGH